MLENKPVSTGISVVHLKDAGLEEGMSTKTITIVQFPSLKKRG